MSLYAALFGFAALAYLYGGYLILLVAVAKLLNAKTNRSGTDEEQYPSVTVLLTVHNEVNRIERRLTNLLDCEYPAERLEILVASDGSTDGTDECVRAIADQRVKLFRPVARKGKTDTQNQALTHAHGEIVVFTDADTVVETLSLQELVRPFAIGDVGGVDGHVLFARIDDHGVSCSQGYYWTQELLIRKHESSLGVLAVASGAWMAVRRRLLRPMGMSVGEDCIVPLNVVDQGYRMVHAERAIAYDQMEYEPAREFKTRVRMTLRNWEGTWSFPHLLNPFKHPAIAWSLWSHKILRWLSPVFLLLWLCGSTMLLVSGAESAVVGTPAAIFLLLAVSGAAQDRLRVRLPGGSVAYSFCLANAGFLVGIYKSLRGARITAYR